MSAWARTTRPGQRVQRAEEGEDEGGPREPHDEPARSWTGESAINTGRQGRARAEVLRYGLVAKAHFPRLVRRAAHASGTTGATGPRAPGPLPELAGRKGSRGRKRARVIDAKRVKTRSGHVATLVKDRESKPWPDGPPGRGRGRGRRDRRGVTYCEAGVRRVLQ